jgi:hypothetical protein
LRFKSVPIDDRVWGQLKIFGYTFERHPRTSSPGFYPPDEVIPTETSRNREAVLRLLEISDCPYRAIGKESQYCGVPSSTVYFDDFEAARGWTASTTGATNGRFERGDPAATSSGGAKQLGTTVSGVNALVTAAAAGAAAGTNDVDGGVTTITSPAITLPASGTNSVTFQSYFAHLNNSGADDFFRLEIVGSTTAQLLNLAGAATNVAATYSSRTINIPAAFAGQTVRFRFSAADNGTASLVEASVDDFSVRNQ